MDILEYGFLLRSLLAALFSSITAGIAGTYIVTRRMVFLSGGITHASFGGIGIAYFLGMNPVVGAALFGVASALGVEFMANRQDVREDSAIGFLWAFGMAVGIIFIYLTPGYTPDLMSYLFGSILTISNGDLVALGLIAAVAIAFFSLFYRTIVYISFDESYARTFNPGVDLFKYLMVIVVALVIVLNIRIAGVVLVISLLTIPPNTAMLFTRSFIKIILASIIVGFTGILLGLAGSWYLDTPTGAAVIFALVAIWFISRLLVRFIRRPSPVRKQIDNSNG